MTNLTEQWKKGELEQGWYYIECIDLPKRWIDIDYYRNDCYEDEGFCKGFFDHNDWRGIDKVLAPVPSYEEWQELKEEVEIYHNNFKLMKAELERELENQQLKDVISKMCMELVDPDDDMSSGLAEYFNQDLLLEIHEVLK